MQTTNKDVSNTISLLVEQHSVIRRQLIYQLGHSTFLTATRGRTGHGQRQAHKYKYYKYRNTEILRNKITMNTEKQKFLDIQML